MGLLEAERSMEEPKSKDKDGFRRLATAAAFASLFSYAVVMCVTEAAMREIGRSYRKSESALGWLYFLEGIGFFVAVLAGGRLSDRRGKLPIVAAGCVMMSAGAYLFAWTPSFDVAFAAMLLMGIGGGFSEGIAMAAVSDLYGGRRRTAMLNWSQVAFAVGAVAAPMAVARLFSLGGSWRMGYIGAAVISAAATLVALASVGMRREKPLAAHGADWQPLLSDPLVIWLSIGIMLYVGAECGLASWLSTYFEKDLHSTPALAASTVALLWGGISAGRAAAAWVSRHTSDTTLVAWALGLSAAFQAVLLFVRSPVTAAIVVPFLGFSLAPVWPTILSRAGAEHPLQSGTVFGMLVAMGAVGFMIFPPAIGRVGSAIGMSAALWICFAILVVNLGIFARLRAAELCERRQ